MRCQMFEWFRQEGAIYTETSFGRAGGTATKKKEYYCITARMLRANVFLKFLT